MMKATLTPLSLVPEVRVPDARARQARSTKGAEIIRQRIKQGVYKAGDQLPSLRALSSELNLSYRVVQRAVRQLEGESLLESRHGIGVRVLESADCSSTPLLFGLVQPYFTHFSLSLQNYVEHALDERSNLCVIKSSHNDPARERREIERLINSGVNGLLIWPVEGDTNGEFLQEVAQRLPTVFVDRTVEGVRAPSVVLDYEGGARQIMRRFYKKKCRRVLVVCDPVDISSFNQLKKGMREEAELLGMSDSLTIFDYPVLRLIEKASEEDYEWIDASCEQFAPLLQSGSYDGIFCPQDEFFDLVVSDGARADILAGLHCITLYVGDAHRRSRRYRELNIEEWKTDTTTMLVQALEMLQDMTLTSRTLTRIIRIPIQPKTQPLQKA